MFEDERIKSVKKITNWDMNISKCLDDLMDANTNDNLNDYEPQLDFPQTYNRGGRNQGGINLEDWFAEKYKINKGKLDNLGTMLKNFETVMMTSRQGGTNGKMRDRRTEDG